MKSKLFKYLNLSRARAREGHLPAARQLVEALYLLAVCGVGPGYYHRARMYRRDLPFSQKRRYRMGRHYKAIVDRYNPRAYRKISQNKLAEKALFSTYSIPTARLYGVYHAESGYATHGAELCEASDLQALVRQHGLSRLAVKCVEGFEGRGFDIVEFDDDRSDELYSTALARSLPVGEYLASRLALSDNCGLILEDAIVQHPSLAALNPSSVNTLRMWVTQHGKQARVRSAILKVGAPGSLVDFTTDGGAYVPVDISTGRLGTPVLRGNDLDPDAAAPFSIPPGLTIPYFIEACEAAKRALKLFPHTCFAGTDVAITADGPLIVEMNVVPDPIHAATIQTPQLDLLEPLPDH